MRWRGQRHHNGAALEGFELVLQGKHLGIRDVGVGKVLAGVFRRVSVIAKPGIVGIAYAARQDQVVVLQRALGRAHGFLVALDGGDFGMNQAVAVLDGGRQHVVVQEIRVDDVNQPLVAHGAGPERGVTFDQHHLCLGHQLGQVLGSCHPTPAAPTNDNARALGVARQDLAGVGNDGGGREAGRGQNQGSKCGSRRGQQEVSTIHCMFLVIMT